MAASDAIRPACPPLGTPGAAAVLRKPFPATLGPQRGPLSTSANFRWALTGNLTYAGCQFLMSTALAKLGSKTVLGQFSLGLAIAAPVMNLAMLQLRSVQVTDVNEEYAFADYFGARIIWTILGFLVIVVGGIIGSTDRVTLWVVILVGLMKSFDSLSDIIRGLFQHRERMDFSGMSLIVKSPTSLLALTGVMYLTRNVVLATAAMAVVWASSFVTYDLRRAARMLPSIDSEPSVHAGVRPRFQSDRICRLSRTALPLGIVMSIISLQISIPRYVLQGYAGAEQLGCFAAVVAPAMAGLMVTTALGQASAPRLARHFATDLRAFVRLLAQLTALSAAMGVALIVGVYFFGDLILTLLFKPEYAAYQREFVVVALAMGIQFVGSCWGYGLTAARYFRIQVVLTSASCVATLIAAFILVPRHGVMGAVLSVLATSVTTAVGFAAAMFWAIRSQRSAEAASRADTHGFAEN